MDGQTEAGGTQGRSVLNLDEARICEVGVLDLPEVKILKSKPAQIGRIWDQNAFKLPLVRPQISPSTIICTINPAQMDCEMTVGP
jgi:hypothetical protein